MAAPAKNLKTHSKVSQTVLKIRAALPRLRLHSTETGRVWGQGTIDFYRANNVLNAKNVFRVQTRGGFRIKKICYRIKDLEASLFRRR